MNITIKSNSDIFVVSVSGKMDAANCGELEEKLDTIITEGAASIILNLDGLDYISSAGLRVILKIAKQLHGSGTFVLCALNENVKEIIEMSGFTHFMSIYQDVEEATKKLQFS